MAAETHSKLGASGAHRWLYCAGSVKAIDDAPEPPESPFAEEGHKAHAVAEQALKTNSKPVSDDPEMIEYVQEYVDYVKALCGKQEYEQLVDYSDWVKDGFGTADAIVIVDDVLHVIDLKYGKGVPVDADDNPQGKLYALGALSEREMLQKFSKVVIHIHQPRLDHVSTWETTPSELYAWAEWVRERAALTELEFPERVAGEKQCRWCSAKPTCHAIAIRTENALMAEFKDLTVSTPPTADKLTDQDLQFVLNNKPLIEQWLKSVEDYVRTRIESGEQFPGWKIVHGRAIRKWTDETEAEKTLIKLLKDKAHTKKLISVAQAEKALGKEGKDKIKDFVTKPEGAPVLVPETDNLEAISFITADDF